MVFTGKIESDFLKLVSVADHKKDNLIDYSATDFLTLRDALVRYIQAAYPLDYNNFIESDLGIMLIEQVAYMGSVLSFKADMLANEGFLRTARTRNSVKKLMELIGVRMRGPLASSSDAKLVFDNPLWTAGSPTYLTIAPRDRTIAIPSPEDGAPVNLTLYKVNNGLVDVANDSGSLTLYTESEGETPDGVDFRNLVFLEGALVSESGEFTDNALVKTVALNQAPVIEGSVEVFVEGGVSTSGPYSQVDNIYFASGSSDKVFQVVSTDDFQATVVFGDNKLGVAPNAGDSYFITYRIGGGTRGNFQSEVVNAQLTVTTSGGSETTGTVENISQAVGGSDAETINHAKRYGPLTFRRQDRLVTLPDFKSFANNFISDTGSVGKATAIVRRAFSSANVIDLFVLERANDFQLKKATPTFKTQLLSAIEQKKMLTSEVVVVDGLIRTLDLAVTINIDKELKSREEGIKLRARDKILEFFLVDNNDFGKPFITADLTRAIFTLDEVRFATVDNVDEAIRVSFREIIQLNNLVINVKFV